MNYVFRQLHYDFSSRGRQSIQIKENGEIIFSEPGRNDRLTQEIVFNSTILIFYKYSQLSRITE
jgi:hypothetical protein